MTLFAGPSEAHAAAPAPIHAIGAENFYANVISQIGGRYVAVTAILSNPNTDPHSYESSTADASAIASADLVVQNGIGYDGFMNKMEAASPRAGRTVIDVGSALGFKAGDNPHLWYRPQTMPYVAALVERELARRDPQHAAEFEANRRRFVSSLRAWTAELTALHHAYAGTPVAVTEPVFNYTAQTIGLAVRTPASFQLAIEEGNDPAPQDVAQVRALLASRAVRVFIYNQQTVEPTTAQLLDVARSAHVPVVGVYETMPPGLTYQSWMKAEADAVGGALRDGRSTESLK
ncbi:MAG TPA: zinc ABC transporter substrate-binding protein [Candidatus Acidoferrum sp.]|nr:zinc ABC transporter substrate-binding protein [Candidatus Acidoferrum sp.]